MKPKGIDELQGALAFVGAMWAVYLVGLVLPIDLNAWGINPRHASGLPGIAVSPFLHANLQHLAGNTIPLLILLTLLAKSRARSWFVVLEIVLLGGSLLWVFGRSGVHIGASGLIFGLVAFLIVSGILERKLVPLAIAIVVGFFYGGTLLAGIVPWIGSHVSWDGHLFGAVAGAFGAYYLARGRNRNFTTVAEGSEE